MKKLKKFDMDEFIATFCGIGWSKKMPGTMASAVAFIIAAILHPIHWAEILAVIIIGTWFSDRYSKKKGIKDPPEVVIDEVAGMWISMYALPAGYGLPALVLFRIIDILKPFPVNVAEKLPGGIGIMADDIVGGVMVWFLLFAIRTYLVI
jgi:phosphatidylglycerophosphatase A